MALPHDETAFSLCLEAVPPLVADGEGGIQRVLDKIEAIHTAIGLRGVNIPEIREESSKSDKGERVKPFEPRIEPRVLARRVTERFGLECMINRVVVHLERQRQADWFRETWEEYGVRQFVLVGGEKSSVNYPGPQVPEANTLLRESIDDPGLRIGNICIPTRTGEAARILRKLETGADFFTTQIVYHPEEFIGLLDALAAQNGEHRPPEMLLTVCPIKSARNLRFLHWLGVSISPELEEWLTSDADGVPSRSLTHIEEAWQAIDDHRRCLAVDIPVGISLAPIGRIPNEMTVSLGRRLGDIAARQEPVGT